MRYTDTKSVMHGHLDEIHRALAAAYTFHEADDICREAKNIGGVHRQSNLTKALETALGRTEGYLAEVSSEPDGQSVSNE